MSIRKEIGKIKSVRLGRGGYDDAMFGYTFVLGGNDGWGVLDFWGFWLDKLNQGQALDDVRRLAHLMEDAKVKDFNQLVNVPIEATFDGMQLESWRILTEVL